MKRVFKKLISTLLVSTLTLSSAMSVYGVEDLGNLSGSGGGSGSGNNAVGGNWNTEMQGIRVTVINRFGEPAMQFMGKDSLDLLFSTKNLNPSSTYFVDGVKTQASRNILAGDLEGLDTTVMTIDSFVKLANSIGFFIAEYTQNNYKNLTNLKTPLSLNNNVYTSNGDSIFKSLYNTNSEGEMGTNALLYSILNMYTGSNTSDTIQYLWQPIESGVSYNNVVWDTFNNTFKQSTSTNLTTLNSNKSSSRNTLLSMNAAGEYGSPNSTDLSKLKVKPNSDMTSYITPTKLVENYGYGIVIEPIIWTKPRIASGDWEDFYIYGTQAGLGYLIQRLDSNGKLTYRSQGWNYGGYDISLFGRAGRKVFVLSENVTLPGGVSYLDSNGKVTFDTSRTLTMLAPTYSQYSNLTSSGYKVDNADIMSRRSGWGLMLFWGKGASGLPYIPTYNTPSTVPQEAPEPNEFVKNHSTEQFYNNFIKKDSSEKGNIIKIYEEYIDNGDEDTQNTKVHVGTYVRTDTPTLILINDELDQTGYKLTEWYTTNTTREDILKIDNSTNWNTVLYNTAKSNKVQKGNSTSGVSLINEYEDNTVVLRLVKGTPSTSSKSGDIVLEQSEISISIETIDETISGWGPLTMSFVAPSLEGTCRHVTRAGYTDSDGNYHSTRYCNHNYTLIDSSYSYFVKNTEELKESIQVDIGDFSVKYERGEDSQGDRSSTSEETHSVDTFNMQSVLWRGKDVPTLASYKESSGHILTQLGLKVSKTPSGVRYKNTDGGYIENISILLDKDGTIGDYSTTSGHHSYTKNVTHSNLNTLSYTASVLVKTYRSKEKEIGNDNLIGAGYNTNKITNRYDLSSYRGEIVQEKTSVTWYPYLKMNFQTVGQTDRTDVMVLSEWKSEIVPNFYVESSWSKETLNNLNLTSNQWTVHKRGTIDYVKEITNEGGIEGWRYAGYVLPGGAVFTLRENEKDQTIVETKTFQSYLEKDTIDNVILTGNNYTLQSAINYHTEYAKEFRENLNEFHIVQYVDKFRNKDIKKQEVEVGNDILVNGLKVNKGNISLSSLGLNSVTNTETKYYIKNASDTDLIAGSGKIEIEKELETMTLYKFSIDTNGNVYMEKKEKETDIWGSKTLLLTKNQDINSLSNSEAKQINDKTKIITNLLTATHRNKGQDYTVVNDGTWYNEATDSICLVVFHNKYLVGLGTQNLRSAVLDPALCPINLGTSDLFSKTHVSKFFTESQDTQDLGYMGEFKGTKVYLPNHQNLLTSQTFAIPNVNVQDLSGN